MISYVSLLMTKTLEYKMHVQKHIGIANIYLAPTICQAVVLQVSPNPSSGNYYYHHFIGDKSCPRSQLLSE